MPALTPTPSAEMPTPSHAAGDAAVTRRRRLLLAALAALLAAAGTTGLWYVNSRAESAVEAMARGQYARASEFYAAEARRGDPAAANALANLLYLGLGVDTDRRQAAQLYFDAAQKGHAAAQLNLGHMYTQGMGVNRDTIRAFGWYRMAHIHGNPAAEYYLSQITLEYTLSPLQMADAKQRWKKLEQLVAEGL